MNRTFRIYKSGAFHQRRSLLNSLLFIDVTLINFSGLMISRVALSTFGLSGSHAEIWRWLHTFSTSAALIIVGLHIALHWKWIVSTIKRYAWQPLGGRRQYSQAQAVLMREQGGVQ